MINKIGLNIVKAGTTTSLRSFAQAADIGFKTISTEVKQKLTALTKDTGVEGADRLAALFVKKLFGEVGITWAIPK